jgi:hypothetical protein
LKGVPEGRGMFALSASHKHARLNWNVLLLVVALVKAFERRDKGKDQREQFLKKSNDTCKYCI